MEVSQATHPDSGSAQVPLTELAPVAKLGIARFLACLPNIDLPPIARVLLYGSHARGDFHDESDIDLAVVLTGDPSRSEVRIELVHKIGDICYQALLETGADLSAMVMWEWELDNPDETASPGYYLSVRNDGIDVTAWPQK